MIALMCSLAMVAMVDDPLPSAAKIVSDLDYSGGKATHLLAYFAQEDDRPLYVESALVLVEGDQSWQLIHAYRHPKHENAKLAATWQQSHIYDLPGYEGTHAYDHKPTAAEVDKFLKNTHWEFKPTNGFRLVRGEVLAKTWEDRLGYAPKYSFPKPPEK